MLLRIGKVHPAILDSEIFAEKINIYRVLGKRVDFHNEEYNLLNSQSQAINLAVMKYGYWNQNYISEIPIRSVNEKMPV